MSRSAIPLLALALTVTACAPGAPAVQPSTSSPAAPVAASTAVASPTPGRDAILSTFTLPDITIAQAQNAVVAGSVANDRKLLLGGIGSDLWRGPSDPADEFWMVTDRGPNGQVRVDGANRRTFPIPAFAPVIVKVRASGSTLSVMQTLPIVGRSGKPVGGLSNVDGRDETPYDFAAKEKIAFTRTDSTPRASCARRLASSGSPRNTARRWSASTARGWS